MFSLEDGSQLGMKTKSLNSVSDYYIHGMILCSRNDLAVVYENVFQKLCVFNL